MRRFSIAAAAIALPVLVAAAPAHAAPTYEGNPAGNGIVTMEVSCAGETLTILENSNRSSDNGGWSSVRIVGGGRLTPLAFTFALVDLATGATVFSATSAKGGGHAGNQADTVLCNAVIPTGMTLGQVLSGPDVPPGVDTTGVNLDDPAGYAVTATVVRR
ncbi:MAG: hypothetical protein JWM93_308 [Frankiales bacterium]|nr:hypothetical protein [Frankiales bacterium]